MHWLDILLELVSHVREIDKWIRDILAADDPRPSPADVDAKLGELAKLADHAKAKDAMRLLSTSTADALRSSMLDSIHASINLLRTVSACARELQAAARGLGELELEEAGPLAEPPPAPEAAPPATAPGEPETPPEETPPAVS